MGFNHYNEVALPKGALLGAIERDAYAVSLWVKSGSETELPYRQVYVAVNQTPTDYTQSILRLLKTFPFSGSTLSEMGSEVYHYNPT